MAIFGAALLATTLLVSHSGPPAPGEYFETVSSACDTLEKLQVLDRLLSAQGHEAANRKFTEYARVTAADGMPACIVIHISGIAKSIVQLGCSIEACRFAIEVDMGPIARYVVVLGPPDESPSVSI